MHMLISSMPSGVKGVQFKPSVLPRLKELKYNKSNSSKYEHLWPTGLENTCFFERSGAALLVSSTGNTTPLSSTSSLAV
jgi:hypothetical protein